MEWIQELLRAGRPRPPSTTDSNRTVTALTAANATSATATGIGTKKGVWFSIASSTRFSINFGTSALAAPTDTAEFPVGVYSWWIVNPSHTHFRVMPNANGSMTTWVSSY